ncbi:hypothetical protein BC834DRAFT_972747 [Gloeopeniophorella convolvens]|nr:hypothetical protein BC834DRAFT_972747 [Gloeopeniophorella convolvens]
MHSISSTVRGAAAVSLPQSTCSILKNHRNPRVSINVLPNEILLEIFEHYLSDNFPSPLNWSPQSDWCTLAHVSERWREVLFASAQRLNLIFHCDFDGEMSNAEMILLAPPSVPLALSSKSGYKPGLDMLLDCALQYWDRVGQITVTGSQQALQRLLAAMPNRLAPSLVDLDIHASHRDWESESDDHRLKWTLPTNFLRGLAPRLTRVVLTGISLSHLPLTMLSNPAHLAPLRALDLYSIDHGFISFNALVDTLRAAPQLTRLLLHFNHHLSWSRDEEGLLPATNEILRLSLLKRLDYQGPSRWVEALTARLETPALNFVQTVIHDEGPAVLPNLSALVINAESLRFDRATVRLSDNVLEIRFFQEDHRNFLLVFSCIQCGDRTWSLFKFCKAIAEKLFAVRRLGVEALFPPDPTPEPRPWLNLLLLFSGLRSLCVDPNGCLVLFYVLRPSQIGGLPEGLLPDLRRIVVFMRTLQGRTMGPDDAAGPAMFVRYRNKRKSMGQTVPILWGVDPDRCDWQVGAN